MHYILRNIISRQQTPKPRSDLSVLGIIIYRGKAYMNFSVSAILEAIGDSKTIDRTDFFFVFPESSDKPNARAVKIS